MQCVLSDFVGEGKYCVFVCSTDDDCVKGVKCAVMYGFSICVFLIKVNG